MAWTSAAIRRRINEVTRTYGDWVIWEQGFPCACRAATALRMSAGCKRCAGEGFVWTHPQKLKGILMAAHTDRHLAGSCECVQQAKPVRIGEHLVQRGQ